MVLTSVRSSRRRQARLDPPLLVFDLLRGKALFCVATGMLVLNVSSCAERLANAGRPTPKRPLD
jgi:hypothetical protein